MATHKPNFKPVIPSPEAAEKARRDQIAAALFAKREAIATKIYTDAILGATKLDKDVCQAVAKDSVMAADAFIDELYPGVLVKKEKKEDE